MLSLLKEINDIFFFNIMKFFGLTKPELPLSVFLILIIALILTFRFKFIQINQFPNAIKSLFISKDYKNTFLVLLSSIAASTGLGSTAGIAMMIIIGGIGTVFWIPIITFLLMIFRFLEVYLSHKYRNKNALNGAPQYIKSLFEESGHKNLGNKIRTLFISIIVIQALFVAMVEVNQATDIIASLTSNPESNRVAISSLITIFAAFVIFGGISRIMSFFAIIIPPLAIAFFISSMIIIFANYNKLSNVFYLIISDAFNLKQGILGILSGFILTFKRLIPATESGMGTAGIIYANSTAKDSYKEAITSIIATFFSGIIISMITGIVIVLTDAHLIKSNGGILVLKHAFASYNNYLPHVIDILCPIMTINVLIAWSFYAKTGFETIVSKKFSIIFTTIYLLFGLLGGFVNDFMLIFSAIDCATALMTLTNITILLIFSKKIAKEIKQKK